MPYITKVKGHDGTTIYDVKDTEARRSRVFVGTCTTAAATAAKAISVDSDFTLEKGREIAIKFTYTNTANNPTFSINSGTAKSVFYNTGVITTSSKDKAGTTNLYSYYIYDGTNWVWEGWSKDADTDTTYNNQKLGNAYGIQSNSSASATVTSAISGYTLTAYGRVTIKFFYDVPADATLNITSTGAKNIQVHNGNSLQNVEANYIKAGDLVTLVYDGTRYIITNINRGNDVIVTMTLTSGTASGGVTPLTVTNASHTPAQVSTYLSQNKNVVAIGTVDTYGTIFFTPFLKAAGEGDIYDVLLTGCGRYIAPIFYTVYGSTSADTWEGAQSMGANLDHSHGILNSNGYLSGGSTAVHSGDCILISDAQSPDSDNNPQFAKSNITFGSATDTFLRNDGTWAKPADNYTWSAINITSTAASTTLAFNTPRMYHCVNFNSSSATQTTFTVNLNVTSWGTHYVYFSNTSGVDKTITFAAGANPSAGWNHIVKPADSIYVPTGYGLEVGFVFIEYTPTNHKCIFTVSGLLSTFGNSF